MSINPTPCHSEPVTDVTGVGIRNLLAGNLRKSAGIMRFGNGLPRQSVPQGHLLCGADWLAMTGFFDSLRKTAQRVVFLYFSRSAQQNRRGSNSLPGIPRMAEPFAGALPSPLDLTRFALVEAASSSLPATFQKENTILTDGVSFWSGRRGSNSLPRPWQGRALPDELRPQTQDRLYLSSQRLSTPVFPISAKNSCPPLRAGMPAFIA